MKRIFRIIVITLFTAFVLFMLSSWWVGREWGRDIETLEVAQDGFKFSAKRNEVGVWTLKADDESSLWFGEGYLHAVDREFQSELLRALALGRLSSLFGPSQLKRDRLMRLMTHAARAEWDALGASDPLRKSCENYVRGRKAFLSSHAKALLPVEFKIFSFGRGDMPEWEPWHVLAITRLQTWEFSYDLSDQIRTEAFKKQLGPEWAKLFTPMEPGDSDAVLYKEPLVHGIRPKLTSPSRDLSLPAMFIPAGNSDHVASSTSFDATSTATLGPAGFFGAEQGASNVWIIAEPRTALTPTLCNDPHLSFAWPGPLYPIEYRVGSTQGQGYMLPGTPGIVIGRVDVPGKNFAWGLTIANDAQTQDLIAVSPKTLASAVKVKETFKIRDPEKFTVTEQSFTDEWTRFGPRVNELLDWRGATPREPVALDWVGYRKIASPMRFYLNRNLRGAENLRADLANEWAFPSVNFTWMERDATSGTRLGHLVTGLIFDRARTAPRAFLSEAEASARRVSKPTDRPYVDESYDGKESFFLASSNQAVFPQPLTGRLGYEWADRSRARRVLETLKESTVKAEFAQTDYVSIALREFVQQARGRLSADRLCAEGDLQAFHSCFEVLATLDRWDGSTLASRWEPTLAALWYSKTKEYLWPADKMKKNADVAKLFLSWHGSNGAQRTISNLLASEPTRLTWERLSGKSFDETLLAAFRDSLQLLTEGLGPTTATWAWGNVHTIEWTHPIKFIPEPVGPWLIKSLLGPPISISGSLDTPGRSDYEWNPKAPLEFPSTHGAAARMCVSFGNDGASHMRWTAATGVSGNPLSKWAWAFARDYYYQGKLYPAAH